MKGRINHSSHKFISLTEVEVRLDAIMIREDMKAGLGQTMHTEDIQNVIKMLGVGQDMILIEGVVMGTIQEGVRDLVEIVIMIMEEVVIEIKIMVEIGVGHMKGR